LLVRLSAVGRYLDPPITSSHHVTIYAADLWDGATVI
jgi:hypothetical protein